MTTDQKTTVKKYVKTYPHLSTLAKRAETDPAAKKSLGDQIGRLSCPDNVSGLELLAVCKLGFA